VSEIFPVDGSGHNGHLPKSTAMLASAKLQRLLMLVLVALLAAIGVILVSSRG
jgi:hypothetical protein